MPVIENLNPAEASKLEAELVALLQDAVHDGASVGFLRPLADVTARHYWQGVFAEIERGGRILLVLREPDRVVGSVQLGLCLRANGLHRAEVQKLFVHTSRRRQGYARLLMAASEAEAAKARRSLLYLDTDADQPAESLYRSLGWICVGEIPGYAASPDGDLHGTRIFYKKITP